MKKRSNLNYSFINKTLKYCFTYLLNPPWKCKSLFLFEPCSFQALLKIFFKKEYSFFQLSKKRRNISYHKQTCYSEIAHLQWFFYRIRIEKVRTVFNKNFYHFKPSLDAFVSFNIKILSVQMISLELLLKRTLSPKPNKK